MQAQCEAGGATRVDLDEQPAVVEHLRDLHVQRCLDDLGVLHDQPDLRIGHVALPPDEAERCALRQRFQVQLSCTQVPQHRLRARGHDQRQATGAGLRESGPDRRVADRPVVVTLDQRLLEAVGQDDDAVLASQLTPDLVDLGVGVDGVVNEPREPLPRELAEVKVGRPLSVAEPDRHWHRAVAGEHARQSHEDGGLANADATYEHVGKARFRILDVPLQGRAESIAADDLRARRRLYEGRRPLARVALYPAPNHQQPVREQPEDTDDDRNR
jgi:hypothetical protein